MDIEVDSQLYRVLPFKKLPTGSLFVHADTVRSKDLGKLIYTKVYNPDAEENCVRLCDMVMDIFEPDIPVIPVIQNRSLSCQLVRMREALPWKEESTDAVL